MFTRSLGNLRVLFPSVRLGVRLLREPRVPFLSKLLPIFALVYFVSPIDFVPDAVLPLIGELDDLAILIVAFQAFPFVCPAPAVEHHRAAIAQGKPYSPLPSQSDFIDV